MNEIQVRNDNAVSRFDDAAVINTIKQTVCKGATDAQLQMFLQVCKRTGLDPFLKEIWFVAEKSIIMAARDGYLRVANENPQFDGIETRVTRDERMVPIKAVCTVWRKDRSHPTICEAYYNEYKSGSPVWTKYPSAMISKVAEVLALKRSFAINGVVSEEEMDATFSPAQAQQQVATRKVQGMAAGRTYAEVSAPAPHYEASDEGVPQSIGGDGQDAPVVEAVDTNMRRRLEQFAAIRAKLGDSAYYRILGVHGFTHANEVRTRNEAVTIWRELNEELQAMEEKTV